jgi:hypothetical protein
MHKMGYIGGCIGKNGHGIVHPIHHVMRPVKYGLGFVGISLPIVGCLDILAIKNQFVQSQESITQDDSSIVELQQPPPTSLIDTTTGSTSSTYRHPRHHDQRQCCIPFRYPQPFVSSSSFNSLMKRRIQQHLGKVPTSRIVCGWLDDLSWKHLSNYLRTY